MRNTTETDYMITCNVGSLTVMPVSQLAQSDSSPVWHVLFDACQFDAVQLGASHFDAMPVRRVWPVSRVVHFSRFLCMLIHSALHKEMNNVEM